ncbi:MAG: class I SAM-dependent methyltransferase [Candidatus Methanofastidiosum sp.]|nr:class I SAM-dependent methyltransferase [Methanofastidiosum sp.]
MKYYNKNQFLKKIIYKFARKRAEILYLSLEEFLKKEEIILDVGCGSCNVLEILEERDFNVVALDIKNTSIVEGITPVVYDGKKMPFADNTFELSMILTVLHHTNHQKELIKEVMRVTKNRIIILEDIYTNRIDKLITKFVDGLINLELNGINSNRKDSEWRILFNNLGLKILNVRFLNKYLVFKPVIYELEIK